MTLVIGRRISTPAASRITSPTSIVPSRAIGDPGTFGETSITLTIPSGPRFNLIPSASDKNVTSLSSPSLITLLSRGDCCGQLFGIAGIFGVRFKASSRDTNLGGFNFGTGAELTLLLFTLVSNFPSCNSSSKAASAFCKYARSNILRDSPSGRQSLHFWNASIAPLYSFI